MTSENRTPTAITSTGIAQTLTTPADTVTFIPSGNRDLIRIANTGAEMTCTVTCLAECSMGLDTPEHDFVMTVPATTGDKTYIIPNIDHYINTVTGKISLVFSRTSSVTLGIFEMPAYQ